MKKMIFVLLIALILLCGCDLDRTRYEIKVEMTGSDPVFVEIKHRDLGFHMPPADVTEYIVDDGWTHELHYFVKCTSVSACTINIYEDDVLVHNEIGTYIIWGK